MGFVRTGNPGRRLPSASHTYSLPPRLPATISIRPSPSRSPTARPPCAMDSYWLGDSSRLRNAAELWIGSGRILRNGVGPVAGGIDGLDPTLRRLYAAAVLHLVLVTVGAVRSDGADDVHHGL